RVGATAGLGDVLPAQPLGRVEVDLHRAALPLTADGVLQRVLDLRAVKRAFAGRDREWATRAAQRLHQRLLGALPLIVGTHARFRTRSDLVDDVGEAEIPIHLLQQRRVGDALLEDVLFQAEDVPVVPSEPAHPHDAVQRAARLVAVAGPELAIADRQLA